MIQQRKYISLFLLAGFLIPQAANAVHHFVLDHPSYILKSEIFSFNSPGVFEYHDCNYHLTGTDTAFSEKANSEEAKIQEFLVKEENFYAGILIDEYHSNYYLRGPPSERRLTELNNYKK